MLWKRIELSTRFMTWCFGLRGRQQNNNSRNEHFKFAKDENGRAYVMFAESNPRKTTKSPMKLWGRMVNPRMVATTGEKCPAGIFEEFDSRRPSKSNKSPRFENRENLQTSLTNTFNLSSHFNFTCLSKVNLSFPDKLVLVFLPLYDSLNQGCKLSIKRFHASFVTKLQHQVFNYRFDGFRRAFSFL